MSIENASQGSLFADDFLRESITRLVDWTAFDDEAIEVFRASFRDVFDHFPITGTPNESQTENDLIWPVLELLGWTSSLRQQNLSIRGREDVPDGLLFQDDEMKDRGDPCRAVEIDGYAAVGLAGKGAIEGAKQLASIHPAARTRAFLARPPRKAHRSRAWTRLTGRLRPTP